MKDDYFDFNAIAGQFDEHVRAHLPWYDMVSDFVALLVRHYLPDGGLLYDIGGSLGNITAKCSSTLVNRNAWAITIEPSEAMRSRWQGYGALVAKRAEEVEYESYDVAVMFLAFSFVPVRERGSLWKRLSASLRRGGAIIVVDKEEPPPGYLGSALRHATMMLKSVPDDAKVRKARQLVGVQRPLPHLWGLEHGGREFFRFGEFAGYVFEAF